MVKKDPIDSKAETPAGQPMHGVQGVKQLLLAEKDSVMRNLIKRLFSYALGREVRYKDRAEMDVLLARMKASDYKLRDAILALIESNSFVRR